MKKSVIYIWLFLLLAGLQTNAQNTEFQLRETTANDYLAFLTDTIGDIDVQNQRTLYQTTIDTMAILDVLLSDADYDSLVTTYDHLFGIIPINLDHTAWHNAILTVALRENRFAFEFADVIHFGDYEIEITPVDFDNDFTNEYLLQVKYRFDEERYESQYNAYHIAYLNSSNDMLVTSTPLRSNYAGMAYWMEGSWESYSPRDLNNDGQLEWIVIEQGYNTGPGAAHRKFLRIFAWRYNELINIAPDDFGFSNDDDSKISWQWDDFDGDGVVEFEQTYGHYNNWSCSYETVTRIDWSDELQIYGYERETDIIPDSFGCLLTDAEDAMWQGDYETAMPLYEQALDLWTPANDRLEWVAKYQYAQLRLALAYTMLDRIDDAQILLDDLVQQTPATDNINDLINVVADVDLETSGDSGLCVAMHDFFARDFIYIGTFIGYTLVDFENFHTNLPSTVNPLYAGCNLSQFVTDRLSELAFSTDESPVDRFIEADIGIHESINTDLNGDGLDDWLIFPDFLIDPYLFLSEGTSTDYLVLRPDFWVGSDAEVTTTMLSGGVQVHYLAYDVLMTINGTPVCPGNYQVWEFVDNQPRYIFLTDLCEILSLDEIVQADGTELHVPLGVSGSWFLSGDSDCSRDTMMTYTWDGEDYTGSDLCADDYYDEAYDERPFMLNQQTRQLRSALLNDGDVIIFADSLASTLSGDLSWAEDYAILEARYIYALALEKLEQPDDAVQQYRIVIELAPDSDWALLSELRLEPTD